MKKSKDDKEVDEILKAKSRSKKKGAPKSTATNLDDNCYYKKRGAPKGTVNNSEGKNQYENIYSDRPVSVNLLIEDDELLNELAAEKPRGWKSNFVRDAVSKALKEY